MIFAWLLFISLCSKYRWTSATTTVKRGDMNLIILKVVSSLLVRVNSYIANQWKNVSGLAVMTRLRNSTSIRILVCWEINVAHLPPIFLIIFRKRIKRQRWFSHPMLTVVKQTHWPMLSSGGRLVSLPLVWCWVIYAYSQFAAWAWTLSVLVS